MVTGDGTEVVSLGKRKLSPSRMRQRLRREIRRMSLELVMSGEIPRLPCLLCGSEEEITIHHVEPMRPDGIVFLCRPCHDRAHQPLFRTFKVAVAHGQFSIRPEAVAPRRGEPGREEVPCG